MKKIINTPETFIPEMLEGIYAAHPDELMCVEGDLHCLVSKRKHTGKVGIATGGGSGHLRCSLAMWAKACSTDVPSVMCSSPPARNRCSL